MKRLVPAALVLVSLAACDGTTQTAADLAYIDAYDANVAQVNRVAAMPAATSAQVPTAGSLTYFGTAGLAMDTDSGTTTVADTSLLGDVVMTANFGADDMNGTIDNFVGIVDGQPTRFYSGELDIYGGDLRVLTASQFGANIDGTVFGGGDTINVDGSIIGHLRSEPGRNVSGLSAVTSGGTDFTLNGVPYDGLVAIVAER